MKLNLLNRTLVGTLLIVSNTSFGQTNLSETSNQPPEFGFRLLGRPAYDGNREDQNNQVSSNLTALASKVNSNSCLKQYSADLAEIFGELSFSVETKAKIKKLMPECADPIVSFVQADAMREKFVATLSLLNPEKRVTYLGTLRQLAVTCRSDSKIENRILIADLINRNMKDTVLSTPQKIALTVGYVPSSINWLEGYNDRYHTQESTTEDDDCRLSKEMIRGSIYQATQRDIANANLNDKKIADAKIKKQTEQKSLNEVLENLTTVVTDVK